METLQMTYTDFMGLALRPVSADRSFFAICIDYPVMTDKKKAQQGGSDQEKTNFIMELVGRSRTGDRQAIEALYRHFRGPLFGLAFRYTYNSTAAEDILQDVFLKVFTHLHSLDRDETFVSWLYRVAINTCLSYLRTHKKWLHRRVSLNDVGELSNGISVPPGEQMSYKSLEEAIQNLPTRLKSVFLLHEVQGFKHQEIAQILKCSVGTSKSQLFKARMKIRKQLAYKDNL
jgi:RNA polymerase sigma-70 factor (ECF subfamily)